MDNFFDKLKKGVSKTKDEAEKLTKIVADKTSSMVSVTKLNFVLNETENKIEKVYTCIGRYIYEKHTSGEDLNSELEEFCIEIDKFSQEVVELRQKIAELKDSMVCPSCGEYNSVSNEYCSKCGTRLSHAETNIFDSEIVIDDTAVDYTKADIVSDTTEENE